MPNKKKQKAKGNDPQAIKEAGNKAFMNGNFKEAIKQYTVAIEITLENPNPIFYANRANAELELHNYEECIGDCNKAIELDENYTKSYYRKSKALYYQNKLQESMDCILVAKDKDPDNVDIKKFIDDL